MFVSALLGVAVLSLLAVPCGVTAQDAGLGAFASEARRLAADDARRPHALDSRRARESLVQLYDSITARPLWSAGGRPTRQAVEVIDALSVAETKGLRTSDYDGEALRTGATSLGQATADPRMIARFDVSVSRALLRLLSHLHTGRVDPRTLRFDLPDSHRTTDLAALAAGVAAATDVPATIAAAEPPYAGYVALIDALARYHALAADRTLRAPSSPGATLRPGDPYADAAMLRRLLVAVGDLEPDGPFVRDASGAELYAGPLVTGIVAFQRRHGLYADSVIGPSTMAQLQVPMTERVRRIELTLERWRWLPDRPPARHAVVNVPAFRLSLFEDDLGARRATLSMAVIVGAAGGRRHTPVFSGTMREVVFRPFWNVPPRIARLELLPIIRRQPGYLENASLEIVRGGDDDAIVQPATTGNLERVASGSLRLRQRPGPNNALGLVKFVFPNRYNVYMHGTPEQELFSHARRDFSHGCIRVENPTALAEHVLGGLPAWDRPAIERAVQGDRTIRVPLARPVEVYVLYGTAVVQADGVVYFYDDLYGHDKTLARALGLVPVRSAPP